MDSSAFTFKLSHQQHIQHCLPSAPEPSQQQLLLDQDQVFLHTPPSQQQHFIAAVPVPMAMPVAGHHNHSMHNHSMHKRQRTPSFSNPSSDHILEKRSRSVMELPTHLPTPPVVIQDGISGGLDGWERELQDIMNSFNPADAPFMPEFSPALSHNSLSLHNNTNSPDMPSAILELEAAMQNSSPEMLEGRANNNNNHHLMMSELLLRSTDSTSPAQSFSSAMGMDPSQMTLLSQHDPAAIAEMMAFRSMSPASMNMKQGFETADFEQMFAMSGLSLDHPHPHHHHHHHLNHHQQHLHGGLPDRPQSTPVGLGGRPGKLSRTAAARQQRASSSSFGLPYRSMTPDGDVSTSSERSKREFKCPRPYCSKVYKNTNGLKYHMERGNCEVETLVKKGPLKQVATPPPRKASPALSSSFDDDEYTENDDDDAAAAAAAAEDLSEQEIDLLANTTDIKVITRPYVCRVGGCGKKYKNLNGLKYHHKVSHPNLDFLKHVRGQSTSHPNSAFHHLTAYQMAV